MERGARGMWVRSARVRGSMMGGMQNDTLKCELRQNDTLKCELRQNDTLKCELRRGGAARWIWRRLPPIFLTEQIILANRSFFSFARSRRIRGR